jgi:predicted transcriptional regulator
MSPTHQADADLAAVTVIVGATIVEPPPLEQSIESELTAPEIKWGVGTIRSGFQVLPDTLVRHYRLLEISSIDFVVLLNLTMSWWFADKQPFPRVATIARRINVTERTVQRSLNTLRSKRLVTWETIRIDGGRRRRYDLTGLAERVKAWAADDLQFQQQPRITYREWRAGVQAGISR